MAIGVLVHPRVMERHPELSESDVLSAWDNTMAQMARLDNEDDRLVALGADPQGRLVEMVASRATDGTWVIFHAMTPPSQKTLRELRMTR